MKFNCHTLTIVSGCVIISVCLFTLKNTSINSFNFLRKEENCFRKEDNFGRKEDNFGRKEDNFVGKEDNFGRKEDNFGRKKDKFVGKEDKFVGKEDNFVGKEDNFGRKEDNFGRKEVSQKNRKWKVCDNKTVVENIVYVKIHKTGSSTWKTVLFSYSEKYDLRLCMDAHNVYNVNWPYQIDPSRLTRYYKDKCNIIAEEMVYNEGIINKVMKEKPFLLASVRNPVQHFLSLYKFASIHKHLEKLTGTNLTKWQGIDMYFKNHDLIRNYWITLEGRQLPVAILMRNLQLYSLGLDNENPNLAEITTIADKVDHFILAGNSTESLVILRRKLCCEMHDLYYMRQNVGRSKKEVSEVTPRYIEEQILEYNSGDVMLYNIAQRRLLSDIETYGDQFHKDVVSFETGLNTYTQLCNKGQNFALPYKKECFRNFFKIYTDKQTKLKKQLVEKLNLEFRNISLK